MARTKARLLVLSLYLLCTAQPGYFGIYAWPVFFYALSVLLSPWLFNPQSFGGLAIREQEVSARAVASLVTTIALQPPPSPSTASTKQTS